MALTQLIVATACATLALAGASAQAQPDAKSLPGPSGFFAPRFVAPPPDPQLLLLRLPHEVHPDVWPQPDYFSQALRLSGLKVEDRYRTVNARVSAQGRNPEYVVLPVQTQAFAFAPPFRALLGAELDQQLKAASVQAANQTDVVDAFGPYVRRLDEEAVGEFSSTHAGQSVISLFVGHDGIDHAFVDITVEGGKAKRSAHRTVDLPEEPMKAFSVIAKSMSEMLPELSLGDSGPKEVPTPTRFECGTKAWQLGQTSPANDAEAACLALVVGSLLPTYEVGSIGLGEMPTAARLAWLARAYAISAQTADTSPTAARVRDLSLEQLGYGSRSGQPGDDAVTSRVATLLSLRQTDKVPVRSARDYRDRLVATAIADLPEFAAALFVAHAEFADAFTRTDFCSIEGVFPGIVMRSDCGSGVKSGKRGPARVASSIELLLFQEWRIAAAFKDVAYEGATQGNSDAAREMLAALPADVAGHPFVQRLRVKVSTYGKPHAGETFDGLLARTRVELQGFLQATVDLQRNDRWMGAYSLSEHAGTQNANIDNDPQIKAIIDGEARLLSVMRLDRFEGSAVRYRYERRKPGDLARFLAPTFPLSESLQRSLTMADMAAAMRQRQSSAPAGRFQPMLPPFAVPGGTTTVGPTAMKPPTLFAYPAVNSFGVSPADMEANLQKHPESMALRSRLAIARLKEGASVGDVVAFLNAQPSNERTDDSVSQSHLWAEPAHVLFLSGELDAARPFYQRVRAIGSGSESDMQARVRVALIDGKIEAALVASQARLARYDSDYARRDVVGLMFVLGRSDEAWTTFLAQAQISQVFALWEGAAAGHRTQNLGLVDIQTWLAAHHLEKTQIAYIDVSSLYLHRMAVTDRLPTEADISLLQGLVGPNTPTTRWVMSAVLTAGALGGLDVKAAAARFRALAPLVQYDASKNFMLPLYAWNAAQAGDPADQPTLADIGQVPITSDFDHLLAKTMLLAAQNQTAEALRFLRASRYELGQLTWGNNGLAGRAVSPEFEYGRAVYLMYRKTGVPAFREEALTYARAVERAWPYFAWSYGLEALFESNPQKALRARCRAMLLDPGSYFLQEARRLTPKSVAACPSNLW